MGLGAVVGAVTLAPLRGPAAPLDGLTCLDGVRVVDRCPTVPVSASLDVVRSGRALEVRLVNEGDDRWDGGPVAVELPVPGASVNEPDGTVPADPSAGWRTLNGVVVARCEVATVGVPPGASAGCRLPLLGTRAGVHELWITGFRSAVGESPDLGSSPAAPGVVPAATARSLRFRLEDGQATILSPVDRRDGAGAVQATGPATTAAPTFAPPPDADARTSAPAAGDRSPAPLLVGVATVIAVLTGLVLAVRRRHHRGEERKPQTARTPEVVLQTPRHSEREPS